MENRSFVIMFKLENQTPWHHKTWYIRFNWNETIVLVEINCLKKKLMIYKYTERNSLWDGCTERNRHTDIDKR